MFLYSIRDNYVLKYLYIYVLFVWRLDQTAFVSENIFFLDFMVSKKLK